MTHHNCGMSNDLKEFEDQLEQEALEKRNNDIDDNRIRKDPDGTVYEFNVVKQAWFPKIDDDFIANYQMNYGVVPESSGEQKSQITDYSSYFANPPSDINSQEYCEWYEQYCSYYSYYTQQQQQEQQTPSESSVKSKKVTIQTGPHDQDYFEQYLKDSNAAAGVEQPVELEKKSSGTKEMDKSDDPTKKRKPNEPAWFEINDNKNTNVYVSGLPTEITDDEFKELMNKVGLVAFDPIGRKPKLKLYKDAEGNCKGDGRCCYMKPESIELALNILDGYEFKGHKISVERAKFELKGNYDPTKKKRKLSKHEKKKFQEKQERLLGWNPEKAPGGRPRFERTVVIKHVFVPKEFEDDPSLMTEISADMREECKKYGDVKKVIIYDRHEDGVVTVSFKSPEEADLCVQALNGRWFAQQKLEASNWDGRTKYVVSETEEEMEARLNKWYTYLESDSSGKPLPDKTSKKASKCPNEKASKSPNEKAFKKSPLKATENKEEESTTLPATTEDSNETDEQMQTNISTENACSDPVEPSQMETTPT